MKTNNNNNNNNKRINKANNINKTTYVYSTQRMSITKMMTTIKAYRQTFYTNKTN